MSSERLAMGPLVQKDIESIVTVLLRGLQRQAVPIEGAAEATAPREDASAAARDPRAVAVPHTRFVGAKRKPSPRRGNARR